MTYEKMKALLEAAGYTTNGRVFRADDALSDRVELWAGYPTPEAQNIDMVLIYIHDYTVCLAGQSQMRVASHASLYADTMPEWETVEWLESLAAAWVASGRKEDTP